MAGPEERYLWTAAEDVPIAIERPNGRLVDLLLEAGHPVVPVSPNAIKTWREGEVLSGAKSDAADAEVIAEYLRLRQHRLHVATPYSDATIATRIVVRTRSDLVEQRVAATNQLSALLDAHWPGAKAIFADVESPISLAFLTRTPPRPPRSHLGEKRLAAFLTKQGYSGRRHPAVLLTRLREAPKGSTGTALTAALADAVRTLVGVLQRTQHRHKEPGPLGGHPTRGASGRQDLHVAAKVGSDQRRPDARRVGRLPPSLRRTRLDRRPRRLHTGHQSLRQTQGGAFPMGLQQTIPPGRWPPSPTTADTKAPGRQTSTTRHAQPAKTTHTPCASSREPGSASSGAAGKTA